MAQWVQCRVPLELCLCKSAPLISVHRYKSDLCVLPVAGKSSATKPNLKLQ